MSPQNQEMMEKSQEVVEILRSTYGIEYTNEEEETETGKLVERMIYLLTPPKNKEGKYQPGRREGLTPNGRENPTKGNVRRTFINIHIFNPALLRNQIP